MWSEFRNWDLRIENRDLRFGISEIEKQNWHGRIWELVFQNLGIGIMKFKNWDFIIENKVIAFQKLGFQNFRFWDLKI